MNDSSISFNISHMVYPGGRLKVERIDNRGEMNVCACCCSFEFSHLCK